MHSLLWSSSPSTVGTQRFAADEARVELRRSTASRSSSNPHLQAADSVQIEFFAANAATWQACQLALCRAFPTASGLRGDPKTGIFELPSRRLDDLCLWLAETFEAPVLGCTSCEAAN